MFLNAHTHHFSHQSDVLDLYNQFPKALNDDAKLFSVGIHPAYINTSLIEEEIEIINQNIHNKNYLLRPFVNSSSSILRLLSSLKSLACW